MNRIDRAGILSSPAVIRPMAIACDTPNAVWLADISMRQSMSRRGNCYDNAPTESFFSSFKGEYPEHHHFATRDAARSAVLTYVERFYNPVRLHSSIGYRPPNEFETMLSSMCSTSSPPTPISRPACGHGSAFTPAGI